MVLFLFVIMLLNLRRDEYGHDPRAIQKYLGIALVVIILAQGLVMVSWAIKDYSLDEKSRAAALALAPSDSLAASYSSSPRAVAETLFTKFAYPFEVTSILLLAAIIGAVVIARRRRPAQTQEKESG
jgi:NADH-quinone oxidoreductase subunit J